MISNIFIVFLKKYNDSYPALLYHDHWEEGGSGPETLDRFRRAGLSTPQLRARRFDTWGHLMYWFSLVFIERAMILKLLQFPQRSRRSSNRCVLYERVLLEAPGVWKHRFLTVVLPAQNWFVFNRILKEKHPFWTVIPPAQNGFVFNRILKQNHWFWTIIPPAQNWFVFNRILKENQ